MHKHNTFILNTRLVQHQAAGIERYARSGNHKIDEGVRDSFRNHVDEASSRQCNDVMSLDGMMCGSSTSPDGRGVSDRV